MKNFALRSAFVLAMFISMLACSSDSDSSECAPISCKNGGYFLDCRCNCPDGFTGTDCSTATNPTPSKIRITKIRVLKFPNSAAGVDDLGTNPDIYITIEKQGVLAYTSGYYADANGDGSIYYDFTPNVPIESTQVSTIFTISLWDYDSTSSNDFMTSLYFSPFIDAAGLPSSKIITDTNGNYKIEAFLSYEF